MMSLFGKNGALATSRSFRGQHARSTPVNGGGSGFTRRDFLFAAAGAPAMTAAPGLPQAPRSRGGEAIVDAMVRGGKVIFLRHAATVATQIDTGRLNDRAGQRNLSQQGIAQARELGRAFTALRIPLEEILVSPVYRARDTGELAFGADRIRVSMDIVADDYAAGNVAAMVAATERLLRTPPRAGLNRLLIGHRTPLEMVTRRAFPDSVLPEGALAVFAPEVTFYRLLGTLTSAELTAATRR
jgi:phosphohistidine phosphatase SixA